MPTLAIIGAQWGDEGKGKITDYLAEGADMVVRYQGGANAGHTIKIGEEVFALHLLPSGILRKDVMAVIGNGMVLDLDRLEEELEALKEKGISGENLKISDRVNIVLPYHRTLDGAQERSRGAKVVGTTGRGIGPCYADKISREGIRMGDLLDEELLRSRLDLVLPIKERFAASLGENLDIHREKLIAKLLEYGKKYEACVCDTSVLINDAIKAGKNVMFEGAQGTMLDIDYGTYPYVTSSNCTSAGICTGAGVPPSAVQEVVGIVKAYTTRVGAGPFVTELHDDIGETLLKNGGEFGTTTGRARRCGWLDLVVVRHAVRLNGLTSIALTKLDVLNGLSELKVCTAYEIDGEIVRNFPGNYRQLEKAVPVYETLAGWDNWTEKTSKLCAGGFEALPTKMKEYVAYIEKDIGVPVGIISVGKGRNETIDRRQNKW
ncbi:adenylosuccinate synthase [Candidatus Methanomassiliicoccus intestinalis]|uniref:adenylosuccinate synthase n=1 Tax=Candidatus Methanomassiliicoccus intestinalis TaxID=1406512 RepID=UPI0037DC9AEF